MSTDLTDGPVWPEGYDLIELDVVDSTMAEAVRLLPTLERPTWVMAHRQTAARGRQGRVWSHPVGNLAATLIYRPRANPGEAAKRSFMAANALYESLSHFTDRAHLALKWPNDVLLEERKVAGILLESTGGEHHVDWLAVGIGVNLRHAPQDTADAAFAPTALALHGRKADPLEFLVYLADAYATQERKLKQFGFGRIRQDWLSAAARLGDVITARTPRAQVVGIFDGIDEDGNLVLITGSGPQTIAAADVYFGG